MSEIKSLSQYVGARLVSRSPKQKHVTILQTQDEPLSENQESYRRQIDEKRKAAAEQDQRDTDFVTLAI